MSITSTQCLESSSQMLRQLVLFLFFQSLAMGPSEVGAFVNLSPRPQRFSRFDLRPISVSSWVGCWAGASSWATRPHISSLSRQSACVRLSSAERRRLPKMHLSTCVDEAALPMRSYSLQLGTCQSMQDGAALEHCDPTSGPVMTHAAASHGTCCQSYVGHLTCSHVLLTLNSRFAVAASADRRIRRFIPSSHWSLHKSSYIKLDHGKATPWVCPVISTTRCSRCSTLQSRRSLACVNATTRSLRRLRVRSHRWRPRSTYRCLRGLTPQYLATTLQSGMGQLMK